MTWKDSKVRPRSELKPFTLVIHTSSLGGREKYLTYVEYSYTVLYIERIGMVSARPKKPKRLH